MANNPAEIIVPSQTKDTRIPLYQAVGLSAKQSDMVYFRVKEEMLPKCKTSAELLRMIIDDMHLTIPEKVWAAYNMDKLAIEKATPAAMNCFGGLFRKVIGQ